MGFCQLAQAKCLRAAPKRSTLSCANEHRPWKLFEAVFYQWLGQCQQAAPPRTKFRFQNKLLLLDITVIDLCVMMF
jgi:hypothetical protein